MRKAMPPPPITMSIQRVLVLALPKNELSCWPKQRRWQHYHPPSTRITEVRTLQDREFRRMTEKNINDLIAGGFGHRRALEILASGDQPRTRPAPKRFSMTSATWRFLPIAPGSRCCLTKTLSGARRFTSVRFSSPRSISRCVGRASAGAAAAGNRWLPAIRQSP